MIVHILYNDDKFVDNYIEFFNDHYNDLEHYYVLYGRGKKEDEKKYSKIKNVILINKLYKINKMINTYKLMKKSDKIVIFGIYGLEYFLFLILNKKIWNKIYLFFWGGDFYQFRDLKKNKLFMLNTIKNSRCLIMNDYDYNALSDIFNIKKDHIYVATPCYDYDVSKYVDLSTNTVKTGPIKIIVGNSANEVNQHIEVLELLAKYNKENILIYCPLSYGNVVNRENVIKRGHEIFGDKFIPLTEFIEYDKYIDLLSSCNVAIFNHKHQMAFGNILLSLALGLKVYVNEQNILLSYFSNMGCQIFNIVELEDNSLDKLIEFDNKARKENNIIISRLKEDTIKQWNFLRK